MDERTVCADGIEARLHRCFDRVDTKLRRLKFISYLTLAGAIILDILIFLE